VFVVLEAVDANDECIDWSAAPLVILPFRRHDFKGDDVDIGRPSLGLRAPYCMLLILQNERPFEMVLERALVQNTWPATNFGHGQLKVASSSVGRRAKRETREGRRCR
jgi:hypothetical protein